MFSSLLEIAYKWLPSLAQLYEQLTGFLTTNVNVMGGDYMVFELIFGGSVVAYLLVQVIYAFIP